MSKVTFTDIIALAKSGWTPAAVQELIKMDDIPEKEIPEVKKEEVEKAVKEIEPDYKKLYEEEKAAREALQAENTKKDVEPEKVDLDDILLNIKEALY